MFKSFYKNKKIIITGGIGFIGSNLAQKLSNYTKKIKLIDNLDPLCGGNIHNLKFLPKFVKLEKLDLRKKNKIKDKIVGADFIFNLAAHTGHYQSMVHPFKDLETNALIHLNLLEICKNLKKKPVIIFTGTRGSYGNVSSDLPTSEKQDFAPIDINGIHNITSEFYHLLYYKSYGLPTVCLRLTNTYGPMQTYPGYVLLFIKKALENGTITVHGRGEVLRDLIYVEDVVDSILLSAANKKAYGEVFNIGTGKGITVNRTAEIIVRECGSGKIEYTPYTKEFDLVKIGSFVADIGKFRNYFSWLAKTDFITGIRNTINFYKRNSKYYLK